MEATMSRTSDIQSVDAQHVLQTYKRMLRNFFGRAGKPPDQVGTQDVFA